MYSGDAPRNCYFPPENNNLASRSHRRTDRQGEIEVDRVRAIGEVELLCNYTLNVIRWLREKILLPQKITCQGSGQTIVLAMMLMMIVICKCRVLINYPLETDTHGLVSSLIGDPLDSSSSSSIESKIGIWVDSLEGISLIHLTIEDERVLHLQFDGFCSLPLPLSFALIPSYFFPSPTPQLLIPTLKTDVRTSDDS